MTDIKKISDDMLESRTKDCVAIEKRATLEVLRCLEEIERRRLHLRLASESLFSYCVDVLGYSDSEAHHRIKAMELLKALPDLAPKIEKSSLSLTTASKVQSFFIQEKTYTLEAKLDLVSTLEAMSTREVDVHLARIATNPKPLARGPEERVLAAADSSADGKRVVYTELKILLTEEEIADLHMIKNFRACAKTSDAVRLLIKMGKKEIEKKTTPKPQRPTPAGSRGESANSSGTQTFELKPESDTSTFAQKPQASASACSQRSWIQTFRHSRFTPINTKRVTYARTGVACTFTNHKTGKRCGSTFNPQIDHIIEFARGGSSRDPNNLTVLCGAHNRFRAEVTFGVIRR